MKAHLLLILIVSALCILSCGEETDEMEPIETSIWKDTVGLDCKLDTTSSLDSLFAYWKANEPAHYSYLVIRHCFCDNLLFRFEVKNGVIDSIYFVDEEGDYEYYLNFFPEYIPLFLTSKAPRYTIEGLFETLKEGRSSNPFYHTSYFNEQYGFPCSFSFNPEEDWYDDEYSYEILNFTIAEP